MTWIIVIGGLYCGFMWALAVVVGAGERNLSFWQVVLLILAPVSFPVVFVVDSWSYWFTKK